MVDDSDPSSFNVTLSSVLVLNLLSSNYKNLDKPCMNIVYSELRTTWPLSSLIASIADAQSVVVSQ